MTIQDRPLPSALPVRQVNWTFCAACGGDVATAAVVPHYRGGGNFPLCPSCADPAAWVRCDACRDASPFELMIVDYRDDAVYCPCVPVADLEFLGRALGGEGYCPNCNVKGEEGGQP